MTNLPIPTDLKEPKLIETQPPQIAPKRIKHWYRSRRMLRAAIPLRKIRRTPNKAQDKE